MFVESRSLVEAGGVNPVRPTSPAPRPREKVPLEVFAAVLQKRWIVVGTTVLSIGCAIAYVALATPLYTATSRLYVSPDVPARTEMASPERSKNYLNTQCELLKSTPIVGPVAEMQEIKAMKLFEGTRPIDLFLKEELNIELGNQDDLIQLSLDSTDPHEGARVVNAVVESYVAYQSARRRTSATEMLKILRKEKEAREQDLADQRLAVLKFKQENAALSLQDERGGIGLQRLGQLSDARTAAQMKVIEAAASHEVARAALSDPTRRREVIAAVASDASPAMADRGRELLQSELYEAQLKLTVTKRQLGDGHPSVGALVESIAQLESKLEELDLEFVKARLLTLEQNWRAAKHRLEAIEAAFQEQRKEALELSATAAKLAVLESGVEQAQKLLEGIDARIKELGVDGETGALNVTVLEQAVPADKPSKPRKPLVLLAASFLGMLLGSSLAFIRASTDRRLRSSEDVEAALGVPVLTAIPRIKRRRWFGGRAAGPAVEPWSEAADAYRTARTAIHYSNRGHPAKTIVVTSAVKGEGKSTLAANLSAAMAYAGERVLLIDADLRRPSLHKVFKTDNRNGLSTILGSENGQRGVVHATVVDRLHLLPSGPIPPNPSELLNSPRFAAFLTHVSRQYDRVVLDAPPVLGMADALILGARCDSTLLVVRADYSDRRAIEAAYWSLLRIGVRSVAAVLNAVGHRNSYSRYAQDYYREGQKFLARSAPAKPSGLGGAPVEVAGGELHLAGDRRSALGNGDGGNGRTVDVVSPVSVAASNLEDPKATPNLVETCVRGGNGHAVANEITVGPVHQSFVHVGWDTEVPPPQHGGSNGANSPVYPGR